jgi:molybdate transport system substrate-binding protein
MVVRAGMPKPDISTPERLTQTLLEAKSIAYSANVSGDYLSNGLFARRGAAEQVRSKSRRIAGERVAAVVARAEVEIGFQQISELLPVAGVDYVSPLPEELQRVTLFSAGVASRSRNRSVPQPSFDFMRPRSGPTIIDAVSQRCGSAACRRSCCGLGAAQFRRWQPTAGAGQLT